MRHVVMGVWLAATLAVTTSGAAPSAVLAAGAPSLDEVRAAAPRDTRRGVLQPKVKKLLLTELTMVERLYQVTEVKDTDHPRLARRLAEGYVELAASAQREVDEAVEQARSLQATDPSRARLRTLHAVKTRKIVEAARNKAVGHYRRLNKQHPDFCQVSRGKPGARGCADEVTYYLALAHERAGDLEQARRAYLELVQHWPKSDFIPHAYYAFGNLFFGDAQKDPAKWPIAEQFFEQVLRFPPPDNPLFGFAYYLRAKAHAAQGQRAQALNVLLKLQTFTRSFPTMAYAAELQAAAEAEARALGVTLPAAP